MTEAKAATLNNLISILLNCQAVYLTRREIANRAGLKKSPYLYALLDQLVSDGHIVRYTIKGKNDAPMYVYAHRDNVEFVPQELPL